MRPLADRRAGVGAGLQDDVVDAALGGVRGGGQADGAGTDDDQGMLHDGLLSVRFSGDT